MKIEFNSIAELTEYIASKSLANIETPEQCKEIIRAMLLKHGYDEIERVLELTAFELRKQGVPVKGITNELRLVVEDEEGRMAHG